MKKSYQFTEQEVKLIALFMCGFSKAKIRREMRLSRDELKQHMDGVITKILAVGLVIS